ncbi:hypothetical protein MKW98_010809, partial [Papaver atlanticum]
VTRLYKDKEHVEVEFTVKEITDNFDTQLCAIHAKQCDKQNTFGQLNIGHIDDSGIYTGHFSTFALSGFLRAQVPTHLP